MRLAAGVDVGATLAKTVLAVPGDVAHGYESAFFPARDLEAIASFLTAREPAFIAATGAGAQRLARRLEGRAVQLVGEFEAWGTGERLLLERANLSPTSPHLLVSLGTGTSILCVEGDGRVRRLGGTALGGGTLLGLGQLLLGTSDHEQLAELAARGDRRHVDLLVSDIYQNGEIPLAGDLTAANFGKVESPQPQDLAQALARLVAENVGLLAGALAAATARATGLPGRLDVVFAGSTLRHNRALKDILEFATSLAGGRPLFPPDGEFGGALGALAVAEGSAKIAS